MAAADWAALQPEWLRLRSYAAALQAGAAVWPGTSELQVMNTRNALNVAGYWIDRLSATGELGYGVLQGTVTPERWARVANEQGRTLQIAWEALSPVTQLVRVWDEIVVPTATGVQNAVTQAATKSEGILDKLIVLGAIWLVFRVMGFTK